MSDRDALLKLARDLGSADAKAAPAPAEPPGDAEIIATLARAVRDLLVWATPGGVAGPDPVGWTGQGKRVCAAARAALRLAEGGGG